MIWNLIWFCLGCIFGATVVGFLVVYVAAGGFDRPTRNYGTKR